MKSDHEKICPLCHRAKHETKLLNKRIEREYYQCLNCSLVFVDRDDLLCPNQEKLRYKSHQNHVRSPGYEKFLRRIIDPITKQYGPKAKGLDFGEGPYPMLREILADLSYNNIDGYDIYFNPTEFSHNMYDFITCSEVIEHLSDPREVLARLFSVLKQEGVLAISTGILTKEIDFELWHYPVDRKSVV